MRGSASRRRSPAQRAAKAKRSDRRGREDYGWGRAGGVTKPPNPTRRHPSPAQHPRQREPEGRSPAQRAAKAKRSDRRGREDYGWGRAGGNAIGQNVAPEDAVEQEANVGLPNIDELAVGRSRASLEAIEERIADVVGIGFKVDDVGCGTRGLDRIPDFDRTRAKSRTQHRRSQSQRSYTWGTGVLENAVSERPHATVGDR